MGEFSVSNIVVQVAVVRAGDKNSLKNLEKELTPVVKTIGKLNVETEKYAKMARSAAEAEKKFTDSIKKGEWGTKSATTTSRTYYDEHRKGVVTLKETEQTNAGLIDTMNNLRWSMVNVMFAFSLAAGLAYPFYEAAKAAGEFELQLKKIQAVTGASPESAGAVILSARK